MDRSLLKNIIIIILVLVNGFLLASLFMRQTSAVQFRQQTEEQLTELFAADGVTLEPDKAYYRCTDGQVDHPGE